MIEAMFDHVTIRVSDRTASQRFYETVLRTIAIEQTYSGEDFLEWDDFSLAAADTGHPVTRRLHVGFSAPSREHVNAFWRAGVAAVPPGTPRQGGNVDHLWIRVADVDAATRFYETVSPAAGFRVGHESAERTQFACVSGSFSVVAGGEPSENVHLAFAAPDDETVDRFHADATAAGYRDNGPPGVRPAYHEGYYAAFVLDPDGNNVEVVNHNRSS
jgi:catechol 2,3-dioxygenase-like lactoylglutathione lyase family enzyme